MTEELKKQSMNALKEFAKYKNSYENMPDILKNEKIIFWENYTQEFWI